jgi:DNA polymerase III epsilon subunit-like protein
MSKERRDKVVRIAKELLTLSPVYVDTETTGFSNSDVVIEITVLDTDGTVLLDTLVKSARPVPPSASAVHGITDITLLGAPGWKEVWPQVESVLEGRLVGFYNAAFDLRLLRQTCGLNGIRWVEPYDDYFCIMEQFAQYYGEWNPRKNSYRWKSLEFAGKYFKLPEPNAHRAKEDTYLAKLVFEAMTNG